MNKQEIRQALVGKVITFASVRPFAIEKVNFHGTFIIMVGNGYAVPLDNKYIEPLIQNNKVEVNDTLLTGKTQHINVSIQ